MYSVSVVLIPGKFWASPLSTSSKKWWSQFSFLRLKLDFIYTFLILPFRFTQIHGGYLVILCACASTAGERMSAQSRAEGILPGQLCPVLCCAAGGCQKTPFENLSGLLLVLLQLYQKESQDGAKIFLLKTPVAHSSFGVFVGIKITHVYRIELEQYSSGGQGQTFQFNIVRIFFSVLDPSHRRNSWRTFFY